MPEKYDQFGKKGELWAPKEERGHIRSPEDLEKQKSKESPEKEETKTREEAYKIHQKRLEGKPGYEYETVDNILKKAGITPGTEKAREFMEKWDWKQAKKTIKEKDWYETFTKLGGTRGKERIKQAEQELAKDKKAVETAEVPKEGMKLEEILKEAGIEKPAESFAEAQKRLDEKLREAGGKNLSLAEKNVITREFYRSELGYSIKLKGLFHGKAELLDENSKSVGEFKTFFKLGRKETPMIDFLKERLRETLEGKPAREMTEEEKLEVGAQKAVKETKNQQEEREVKISALQEAKRVGMRRLSKLVEGLAYVAGLDKLAAPAFRGGKKLAIEGSKDLAAIGLSPAAVLVETGREISGRIQVDKAIKKELKAEKMAQNLERIPPEERKEYHNQLLEFSKNVTEQYSDEKKKGLQKIFEKGRLLRFVEKWLGKTVWEKPRVKEI